MSTPDSSAGGGPESQAELEKAFARARSVADLKRLYDRVAVVLDLVRRNRGSLEQLHALAELRLRVGRRIGVILGRTVRRGGHGSGRGEQPPRGGSSLPLPAGISWSQSSRFQHLARISETNLQRYFAEARARQEMISLAAALRTSSATGSEASFWKRLMKAVRDAMDVDLCVGIAAKQVAARHEMSVQEAREQELWGSVFVNATRAPREWLGRLTRETRAGRVDEAMLLFHAQTGAAWFNMIASENWSCCLLRRQVGVSDDHAVAYRGDGRLRFWQAFHGLGAVVESAGLHNHPPRPAE